MKLYTTFFAALVALALTATNIAHAQWAAGGQLGYADYDHSGDTNSVSASGASFGGFAQWQPDSSPFGVHIGIGGDSAKYDNNTGFTDEFVTSNTRFTVESGTSIDLLGMMVFGNNIKWLAMFGLSSVKVDSESTTVTQVADITTTTAETASDTATGWKLAGGAEFAIGEKMFVQPMVEYADLGTYKGLRGVEVDLTQTNFRLNIGYRF